MNLADILDAIAQAERESIRKWEALPDDVRNHHWIARPTLSPAYTGQRDWNMRGVVTGSRRNWKRGA